jgi:hypothetical protein
MIPAGQEPDICCAAICEISQLPHKWGVAWQKNGGSFPIFYVFCEL